MLAYTMAVVTLQQGYAHSTINLRIRKVCLPFWQLLLLSITGQLQKPHAARIVSAVVPYVVVHTAVFLSSCPEPVLCPLSPTHLWIVAHATAHCPDRRGH